MKLKSSCLFVMSLVIYGATSNLVYAADSAKLTTGFKVIADTCEVVTSSNSMSRDLGNIELSKVAGQGEKSRSYNGAADVLDVVCEASKKAKIRFTPLSEKCKSYNGKFYSCGNKGQTVGLMPEMSIQKPNGDWQIFRVAGDQSISKEVNVTEQGLLKVKLYRVYYSELEKDNVEPGPISAEYAFIVYNE